MGTITLYAFLVLGSSGGPLTYTQVGPFLTVGQCEVARKILWSDWRVRPRMSECFEIIGIK